MLAQYLENPFRVLSKYSIKPTAQFQANYFAASSAVKNANSPSSIESSAQAIYRRIITNEDCGHNPGPSPVPPHPAPNPNPGPSPVPPHPAPNPNPGPSPTPNHDGNHNNYWLLGADGVGLAGAVAWHVARGNRIREIDFHEFHPADRDNNDQNNGNPSQENHGQPGNQDAHQSSMQQGRRNRRPSIQVEFEDHNNRGVEHYDQAGNQKLSYVQDHGGQIPGHNPNNENENENLGNQSQENQGHKNISLNNNPDHREQQGKEIEKFISGLNPPHNSTNSSYVEENKHDDSDVFSLTEASDFIQSEDGYGDDSGFHRIESGLIPRRTKSLGDKPSEGQGSRFVDENHAEPIIKKEDSYKMNQKEFDNHPVPNEGYKQAPSS